MADGNGVGPKAQLDGVNYDEWARLLENYRALGPNAKAVLLDLSDRLVAGKAYGDFDKDRNWPEELNQELLDGLVYLTMLNRSRVVR